MADNNDSVLEQIIKVIREAVNEDWILDFEIDADTSFNDDLELESVEFVEIAEKLQQHFGSQINFIDWLSSMNLDQIIALTVGDLEKYVIGNTRG
jgi:acyl carrier protein